MISNEVLLQIAQVITLYCGLQGPGVATELRTYVNENPPRYSGNEIVASVSCLKKIWHCTHNTNKASTLATNAHNCISKHLDGELK